MPQQQNTQHSFLPQNIPQVGDISAPAHLVLTRYDLSKQWRQPYEDRWQEYYRLYRFYRDEDTHPFKSNIFVPYLFSLVESAVPKMLQALVNAQPIITVTERAGGRRQLAKLVERVLDFVFDEDVLELLTRFTDFFKEMAVYGTSVMKMYPSFRQIPGIGWNDFNFSHVEIEPCDLWNVYPDYRAPSPERSKYIIHRTFVDLDDIEEMGKMGLFSKKAVRECKDSLLMSPESIDEVKRQRLSSINLVETYGCDPFRGIIEVLEYWDKGKKIVIGGRKAVLQNMDNPFQTLPFLIIRYCQIMNEFYGMGICEMGEGLQEELNVLRSLRMDNLQLIINRMFIASKIAGIEPKSLMSFPGNVVWANDVGAIKPMETQDVIPSAYQEEQVIKGDLQNVTGEWEHARGAMPPHKETATGIVRLQDATMGRFEGVAMALRQMIKKMTKLALLYIREYMPMEKFAQIVGVEDFMMQGGMEFYQMPLEDIFRCYQFEPDATALMGGQDAKLAQAIQAYQIFNGDPLIDPIVLREMLVDALRIPNKRELLAPAYELVEKYGVQPNHLMLDMLKNGGGGMGEGQQQPNQNPGEPKKTQGNSSGGIEQLAMQARPQQPGEVKIDKGNK